MRRENHWCAKNAVICTLAAITLLEFHSPKLTAAEWPQFRGLQASGVDRSHELATNWNVETGENIQWQTPLPGLAHASPIVWGDRVYIATAVKPGNASLKVGLYGDIQPVQENETHQWRLLALDKGTGKVMWDTL